MQHSRLPARVQAKRDWKALPLLDEMNEEEGRFFWVSLSALKRDEFDYLPVNTVVDVLVRSINLNNAAVIDQFFNDIGRHVEADEMGSRYQRADVGNVELDIKLFSCQQGLKGEMNLVLQIILACRFHEPFFNQLRRDLIAQDILVLAQEIHSIESLRFFFVVQP